MTTREVCKELECTERHVFDLRQRTYPHGHEKAGKPLLGVAWQVGKKWRYRREDVLAYKEWVILGRPLVVVKQPSIPTAKVAARLNRALASTR